MLTYQIDVEDNFYYEDVAVYQYGNDKHTRYSTGASAFVAYAVWEEY